MDIKKNLKIIAGVIIVCLTYIFFNRYEFLLAESPLRCDRLTGECRSVAGHIFTFQSGN
jgi:hypothetical protein